MTTNSSPPSRPSASASRVTPSSRAATAFSSSSPIPWPSVSLMSLKLSRSMKSAATGLFARRERASICSARSRIRVRFGSPVSESWVAMKASSSSRWASASSVRRRSVSKHSHIRTRLNSRLICSEVERGGERLARRRPCSAAIARTVSAITSRHQKQRQVTWSRVAARCTASSPKISQVSRPASIATSSGSPQIQRATATVEVRAIRSKASWVIGSSSRSNRTVRATVASRTSSTRAFRRLADQLQLRPAATGDQGGRGRHVDRPRLRTHTVSSSSHRLPSPPIFSPGDRPFG